MHDTEGEMLGSGVHTECPSDLQFPANGTGVKDVDFIMFLERDVLNT